MGLPFVEAAAAGDHDQRTPDDKNNSKAKNRSLARMAARLAGLALPAAALFVAAPAQAQFVCTTTSTDSTCTNTGTATTYNNNFGGNRTTTTTNSGSAVGFLAESGNGNAFAINTGTNLAAANGISAFAVGTGTATAINNGINTGGISAGSNNGDAFVSNTGTNSGGLFINTIGNGIAINSGTNTSGGVLTEATLNAIAINTGSNLGGVSAQSFFGNATAINSGSNLGGMSATADTGDATAINSGTNNVALRATSNSGNATVINTGSTSVQGALPTASTGGSGIATVINSGIMTGGNVMITGGSREVLTNSGTISHFAGAAITFSGGPDTLNLLAGSTISGTINLVGTNDTINFLSGNHNLTFNTLAGATVNGPDPFVVSGNRAVAIDPTPFGLADRTLMDFTGAVSGLLDGIGAGATRNGPLSSAFAATDSPAGRIEQVFATIPGLAYASDQAAVFKAPTFVSADGRAIWARGFGGERVQDPQNGLEGAHTQFFGGAVGFDMVARRDLRLGVFAGGGESRLTLDGNLGSTNSDMAFGGIYGRWNFVSLGRDSFLDFSLHGGGGNNSTSRTINNNAVAGGLEIATASYNSAYISPDVKYGIDLPLWAQYTLTPSVRVRYVAGFFGGYTETGTTAPLTVASRTIQDFEERGELKLTRAAPVGPDLLLTSVHVGVLGLERAGDTTVNTTLLGINLPFVTPGKSTVGGLVGGGGFEWRTREGISFFGAGEAIAYSDASTVWNAKGGVRLAF